MALSVTDKIPTQPQPRCDIFNTPLFYKLHQTEQSLYLACIDGEDMISCIHFTETTPGVFMSPYRGTYGGFDFKEGVSLENMETCVRLTIDYLTENRLAKTIVIKAKPSAHSIHQSSLLFNNLLNQDFKVDNHEINYTIAINETPLVDKMKRNNKKRFQKCKREGFVFEQETAPDKFESIYHIIQQNRASKGYEVSMTFEQIMDMYLVFPESMYFFKASKSGETIASSVCIRLNEKVLYVFYWGDLSGYGEYSPVVFLANGIYKFAQENGYTILDAGTSSINGQPNYGTAAFKEGLGFEACLKLTYTRTNA